VFLKFRSVLALACHVQFPKPVAGRPACESQFQAPSARGTRLHRPLDDFHVVPTQFCAHKLRPRLLHALHLSGLSRKCGMLRKQIPLPVPLFFTYLALDLTPTQIYLVRAICRSEQSASAHFEPQSETLKPPESCHMQSPPDRGEWAEGFWLARDAGHSLVG